MGLARAWDRALTADEIKQLHEQDGPDYEDMLDESRVVVLEDIPTSLPESEPESDQR